ncbi:Toll/interleukin-1 receptor homology (TIR) domain [Arabidopsis suecica]|uniref:Toll/interleukin-1 receptor homology (TIR) domain n=1 Tax=Arabidopsis suecica TaxID=45249 RepID=A0A8T2B955_ARASU|nr:Toll/interleukin-1 receptor homology (TIR) domain [Arabidopsis suecica]
MKEFKSKAIDIFIDEDIKRSKSIGPELIQAIRGSRIAIAFLSMNYASSSWCLNELVLIMKYRKELGLTVMTLFYDVDPTDVKKQTGDFGMAFKETCKGKTKDEIGRWRHALEEVAKIAGYHSSRWENEADMIEIVTTDISNSLNISTGSSDFSSLVGMEAHMKNLEQMLYLDLNDVRMIGIWGPPGIGKTSIARVLYSKYSDSFDLSVFMENVKGYTRPGCSDEHSLKLHLQQQFLSQILNQKDIEVRHLGVVQDRLRNMRVLVVLDDVDQPAQLEAMAKENKWFGPGSRIIVTTQDQRLLKAHGIKDMYKVDFPPPDEAFQIFCMGAFGQTSPKHGFEELAWEATYLSGIHPSGIKSMGSYFRGMSKPEWADALQRLRTSNPDSESLRTHRKLRNRFRNGKQKMMTRMLSRIRRHQIAAAAAKAASVYETSIKEEVDSSADRR